MDFGRLDEASGSKSTSPQANGLCSLWILLLSNEHRLTLDSELAREKMWSRIHLIPLLTAEEDRDLVRRHFADQAREKDLMGSNTSPYNSEKFVLSLVHVVSLLTLAPRFVRPTYVATPSAVQK